MSLSARQRGRAGAHGARIAPLFAGSGPHAVIPEMPFETSRSRADARDPVTVCTPPGRSDADDGEGSKGPSGEGIVEAAHKRSPCQALAAPCWGVRDPTTPPPLARGARQLGGADFAKRRPGVGSSAFVPSSWDLQGGSGRHWEDGVRSAETELRCGAETVAERTQSSTLLAPSYHSPAVRTRRMRWIGSLFAGPCVGREGG